MKGEENIPHLDNKITRVFYEEEVHATPDAIRAISEADLIIYGIGSVYTSILPNVIIPEISNALQDTRARRVYFCNAMTQPGETDGYSVEDHVRALIQHGAMVDEVLVLSQDEHEYTVLRKELLTFENGQIKHDAKKIHTAVTELLEDL